MTPAALKLHEWRPIFWEPVSGTGERIMVGVLYEFSSNISSRRLIRDDVLDSLYGQQASASAKNLIDTALNLMQTAAQVAGIREASMPLMGLFPGQVRTTGANSVSELLRTAALMYSSLSNLDKLDDPDESDAPLAEEVNKRFSTEVRDLVLVTHPQYQQYFGKSAPLIDGGQIVRFGFFSPRLAAHFSVLHPARQSSSVRDARARLWELARAKEIAQVRSAALITAVPRLDDATLGKKQRDQMQVNIEQITREADASEIRLLAVNTASQAAEKLLEAAA